MSYFPVIDFFGPEGTPNQWSISDSRRVAVVISREGATLARSTSDKSSYLIHNAKVKDFERVAADRGLEVPLGESFSIRTRIELRQDARARIHILEYDEHGERCGETQLKISRDAIFVPREKIRRIVLTIRVTGRGDVVIHDFEVRALQGGGVASPGVHTLSKGGSSSATPRSDVNALRRDVVALEEAGRRISRDVTSLLSSLESTALNTGSGSANRTAAATAQAFARDLLLDMARSLPESNGSHYFHRRFGLRVAIVSDVYMLNFYKDAFEDVVYVRPDEVDDVIAKGFDLFIYVTCWRGVHDDEWRGVTFRERPGKALEALLEHCRSNGIPSVFQSIEDPSNFDYFLPIAEKFDHVFTSDSDCVEGYRTRLGHDHVHYGEYGANPLLNNPVGTHRFSINKAFFAGSYPKRYTERVADMQLLFDSILEAGPFLQIADRNAGEEGYEFPDRFQPYCMAPIPHELLQRVHKLFRYNLNFNSIKSSPTMCAMRVYELQAQGRGIISNYAQSVLNKFPEIRVVAHPARLDAYFAAPATHDEHRRGEDLVRNVMTSATSFDIVARMLDAVGLDTEGIVDVPEVLAVGDLSDERVRTAIERQSYPNMVSVDVLEVGSSWANIGPSTRYVGLFDGSIAYGEHYVQDRVNAFKYVDVAFVTQQSTSVEDGSLEGVVHDYTSSSPDARLTLYALDRVSPETVLGDSPAPGTLGYAIPPYQAQTPEPTEGRARLAEAASEHVLSIIVPVWGNGRFLSSKCLPSIQRNARWRDYEIVLVDDGSPDDATVRICEDLAATHPNVVLHRFHDAGSGSASRPRNKGVELARAPLVTFLDPDNEISDGGYDLLVDLFEEGVRKHPDLGFVSGYQVKVAANATLTGRHAQERLTFVTDAKERFFRAGRFPVVSTQAAVISKRVFDGAGLSFVEGAAGQDTLFGWELLLASPVAAFTDQAHLIYYAERSDSITNAVTAKYFEKALVMERAQVSALAAHDLYDEYVEHHLLQFVRGWYLKKLDHVAAHDRAKAVELLREIVGLYGADFEHVTLNTVEEGRENAS